MKLVGTSTNRAAIGARIHLRVVEGDRIRSVYRYVCSGGSFGANPLRQHVGLGKASRIESLEIFWPTTGKKASFHEVPMNCVIEIIEGAGKFGVLEDGLPRR